MKDPLFIIEWKEYSKTGPLKKLSDFRKGKSYVRDINEKSAVKSFRRSFPERDIFKVSLDEDSLSLSKQLGGE